MEINILPNNVIMQLPDNCFDVEYKKTLVHQVITSYFSNGRENYSSQKNRSEVRGGGKKPWRQKGTGRARAGTTRGPIWRGGGVTFASGKRNFSEKIIPEGTTKIETTHAIITPIEISIPNS